MLGFFLEGSSNVSLIGGRVHCGVCNYHPQISAESGVNVAPTNILIDGVLFEDWQAASSAQHTECLQIGGGIGITIRNSTFRQCATATPSQATASIHVSWYGFGPITRNVTDRKQLHLRLGQLLHDPGQRLRQPRPQVQLDRRPDRHLQPRRRRHQHGLHRQQHGLHRRHVQPPKTAASRSTGATTS